MNNFNSDKSIHPPLFVAPPEMPATHDDETAYFDDDDVTPELDSLAPSTTRPFGAIALESTQSVPSDSSESPAVGSKAYRNRRAKERARIRKQNQRNAEQ